MDEILYNGPRPAEGEAGHKSHPLGALLDGVVRLRRRWETTSYRMRTFFSGRRLRPGTFLFLSLVIGAAATFSTVYTQGYAVTLDGAEVGIVADTQPIDDMVARVERRVSDILDEPYTLKTEITYTPQLVKREKLTPSLAQYESYLFNQVDAIMKTYTLTVDGVNMGSFETRDELDALFDSLKAPYITENTVSCDFTIPIHIDYDYTSPNALVDFAPLRELFTSNTVEELTYTVERGDTYIGIARRYDMTLDELMAMNPEASLNYLYVGDVLTVQQSVPYLSVVTVDRVIYEDIVPAPVEYVDDDTMYQGDSKVLEEGADGLARVDARITYINGHEDHRDILDSEPLEGTLTKVVARGTKERPKTMAKGYFTWPVRGTITSRFGYRSIFGSYSYHSGLDIAVPYGTSVKAADGGKVIKSFYHNSYGNLVVIDHENGYTTYYAHNSKLLVSVGERVYQGQVIAKAGSTGNSTGSHCHFEVRVNGKAQNPLNYL